MTDSICSTGLRLSREDCYAVQRRDVGRTCDIHGAPPTDAINDGRTEPGTLAGRALYEKQRHWYDCPGTPEFCGCGDDDDLAKGIIAIENEAAERALGSVVVRPRADLTTPR